MRWSLKQHEDQHAHGFGKDFKDRAIWVRVPKPQEVRRKDRKKKERKGGRKEQRKKERTKDRYVLVKKKTVNFTDAHK